MSQTITVSGSDLMNNLVLADLIKTFLLNTGAMVRISENVPAKLNKEISISNPLIKLVKDSMKNTIIIQIK